MTARSWLAAALVPAAVLPLVLATPASAATVATVADFDGGTTAPAGFYPYGSVGYGVVTVAPGDPLARPGQTATTNVLSVGADVGPGGFGGFGQNLPAAEDWSDFDGLQFWMHGTGSGAVLQSELLDGSRPGSTSADGERFDTTFTDDWTGWRLVQLPFAGYQPATDYQPNPDNGVLDTDAILGWIVPVVSGSATWAFDDVALYAGAEVVPTVGFASSTASVTEGGTASLTVRLNVASATPVTVDVTTGGGTATPGADYTPAAATLTFAPGQTQQTVEVATAQDTDVEGNETVVVALSSPSGATAGTSSATLTIRDDDAAPASEVWDNVRLVEGFDHGGTLPRGEDADGNAVGFETFTDPSASAVLDEVAPPTPVPGKAADDTVVRARLVAPSYAGFTHKLGDAASTTWVPQDWSRHDGLAFWLYGQNTGASLFVDILDNRNPGSTTDDAGRYSVAFTDDTLGWRYVELPFTSFTRKDVGNGAPNDGLTLGEMHGWAFGSTSQPGERTWYLEDVALTVPETVVDEFEYATLPSGTDADGVGLGFQPYSGGGAAVAAGLTSGAIVDARPGAADGTSALDLTLDVPAGWAGVSHAFDEGGAWTSQDWSPYQGVSFWLHGDGSGETLYLDLVENRAPGSTRDDAERFSASFTDDVVGWRFVELAWADFTRKEIGNGAPADGLALDEVHGWAFGAASTDGPERYVLDRLALWGTSLEDVPLLVGFDRAVYLAGEGEAATIVVELSRAVDAEVTVGYAVLDDRARTLTEDPPADAGRDYTPVSGTLTFAPGETSATVEVALLDDDVAEVDETVQLLLSDATGGAAVSGYARSASVSIADDDATDALVVEGFEATPGLWRTTGGTLTDVRVTAGSDAAYPGQSPDEGVGSWAVTAPDATAVREFAQPRDWSGEEGLTFWFRGTGSGDPVTVELRDDTAPDPGPAGWTEVVHRDDFDEAAGTAADPQVWANETGGWGWGNAESQYYTPGTQNVATDGAGNLAVTLRENTDPSLWCLGDGAPCDYTSARLSTQGRAEFLYGRIEARVKVPSGEGLWPAFWTLGNDFHEVGWPRTGEIDVMEHVEGDNGAPEEAFGTIHGPGYAGGQSIGGRTSLDAPLSDDFHTFAVDWEPERITWYLDGEEFFQATPDSLPPGGEWVFDHPFFLILNMAIGGNFGGTIEPGLQLPAQMLVDYVEVRQAPDTAERFAATFVDEEAGWQQVSVPFSAFERSAGQPAGAPDNGLTLTSVHGLGLGLAGPPSAALGSGDLRVAAIDTPATLLLDEIRVGDVVAGPGTGPGPVVPGSPTGPGTPAVPPGGPAVPGGSTGTGAGSLGVTGIELWAVAASMVLLLAGTALVVVTRRRRLTDG